MKNTSEVKTKSQHTPGPWFVEDGFERGYVIATVNDDPETAKTIVTTYLGGEGRNAVKKSPEDEANARLIAAAPELLETAIYAVKLYNNPQGYYAQDLQTAIDSLALAIAKATGEKQ